MSAATPTRAASLLLTDLPSETLSTIVLLLPPIDALRFSHTCRALQELATVNAHSLWSIYVKQIGTFRSPPSSPAPPSALPSLGHKDALQAFLALVKQSTCSPDHKWHPEAAKASDKPHVQACEACIDARLYTSAGTLGTEARRALLVRALQREGIDLRSDSRLCNGFIRSGHGYIPDIVQTMVRMHIIYAHSVMSELLDEHFASSANYAYDAYDCDSDDSNYGYHRPRLTEGDKAMYEAEAYALYADVLERFATDDFERCSCGRPLTKVRIMQEEYNS